MKKPFITEKQAREIVAKYPTPFHIYDEAGIVENAKELLSAFSFNKGYKEYFAVKATPNPTILRLLRGIGCGVDCASYVELLLVEKLGFRGPEIMFSSNETAGYEYKKAYELGAIINLDDITHIPFLKKHAGIPKKLSLRYNPGGDFKIGTDIMGNPGDAKYGMTRAQIEEAVVTLMREGVEEFGVHAFLASNTTGNDYYKALSTVVFTLIADVAKRTGARFTFANLSGGIGIPYREEQQKVDIKAVADSVRAEYERILTKNGVKDVAIFTELGRFLLGPYGALVTTAIHRKDIYKQYIGVDACAANLMRPAMYGSYHHITVLGKENAKRDTKYDIVGSLCENNDKFAIDRMLPKIDIGDILYIHDTGAHGYSMGYNYNGKLRSAEVLLKKDGATELIRRAETPDDYFATFDIYKEFRK